MEEIVEKKFIVYAHILKKRINGINKKYIGITSKISHYRWGKGSGYINNTLFYKAIKKYGWDGFEHIILAKNLTKKQALKLETFFILKYQSHIREYGYNLTTGGEYPIIRQETLFKKRKSMMGKNKGKNSALAKSVYCLETRIKFDSIREAERKTNIDSSSIGKVCKKQQTTAGNLHWMYENEFNLLSNEEIQNIIDGKINKKQKSGIKVPIKCLNNNKVYDSIKLASIELNLNSRAISDVINNKQHQTKGYKFIRINKEVV